MPSLEASNKPALTDLSDAELNRLVAERVMGDPEPPTPTDIDAAEDLFLVDSPLQSPGKCWWFHVPYRDEPHWVSINFATDPTAVLRMEHRLQDLDQSSSSKPTDHLTMMYAYWLTKICSVGRWINGRLDLDAITLWHLLRATPRQRCLAALHAIEQGGAAHG